MASKVRVVSGPDSLDQYDDFEEYLDSFVLPVDLHFLEDEELARQLILNDIKVKLNKRGR